MATNRQPAVDDQQGNLFELESQSEPQSRPVADSPGTADMRTADEAKKSIRYMTAAVLEYGRVAGIADLLDRVALLCWNTHYKPYNSLLILLQRPAATYVLPAHRWLERYGRVVRPGEQPLVLLQRGGPVMFLFDVSQTEEGANTRPLPLALENPYAMADVAGGSRALEWVIVNAKADGVRVTPAPLGHTFAGCVQQTRAAATQKVVVRRRPPQERDVPVLYDVELNRSYSDTEQLATLAHELGHVYCGHLGAHPEGHWKDRHHLSTEFRELEAESVARVVFKTVAPQAALPEHLSQYFSKEPDLSEADLEPVMKAAGRVLEMSQGFAPRR